MIRKLINGVLRGGLETNTDGRWERWETEPSSRVLLGKEANTQGKERSNERIPSLKPLFSQCSKMNGAVCIPRAQHGTQHIVVAQ